MEAREPAGRARATFAARVHFEDIERKFDDIAALDGLTLTVEPGEVVCLLGPSGCGKTTLLRIASGIERPTSGRMLINDREVAGPGVFVEPEKRSVGLMFQDFALFPHLTILDNITFGLNTLPYSEARHE
ncbi:MAG: ATP-binding cassette domain-containing protein, partial [Pseudomonadota bacterium]